jgi:hypothetical protein
VDGITSCPVIPPLYAATFLPTILVIEELKRSDEEVKAGNVELVAELADVKINL